MTTTARKPYTRSTTAVFVRVAPELQDQLRAWVEIQPPDNRLTLPEALRRLAELGLGLAEPGKRKRWSRRQFAATENAYDF